MQVLVFLCTRSFLVNECKGAGEVRPLSSGSPLESVSERITNTMVDAPWVSTFPNNEYSHVLLKLVHFFLVLLWHMFLRGLWTQWWMYPLVLESRCVPSKWNKLVPHEREQRCILLNFVCIFLGLRRHSWAFPLLLMLTCSACLCT